MYECKINLDSISPDGFRLTTFIVKFPRMILSQINTHRTLTRNSSSSRAIPIEKQLKSVKENPFIPEYWGKNQKGMQAYEEITDRKTANTNWLVAKDSAIQSAESLLSIGIHKQITNRLLEPFMWHTSIISATEFSNFFHLRCGDAQPEIRKIATLMRELYNNSKPKEVGYGQWHSPLLNIERTEADVIEPCKVSVGRCARVSYLTHEGKRDYKADIELHDRMLKEGHLSPFEHVARPMTKKELDLFSQKKLTWNKQNNDWDWGGEYMHFLGNFNGWVQYRKQIPNEWDVLK